MDFLFHNGNIITMHAPARASAVGVVAGRIVAVGDEAALRSQANEHTRLVDLNGRTLIPGFNDSHAHVWKMGHLLTTMIDLRGVASIEVMGDQLRQWSGGQPPGRWLLGRGFNETVLAERRRPTRHDLDRFVSDRPVVLTRTCGHIYAVNSLALQMAGITAATAAPEGGVIERESHGTSGVEPNGLLHETAMGLIQRVMPAPTAADYEAMIVAALRHQLSLGITSSSDLGVLPELLAVYLDLDRRGELPARMSVMPLGRPDGDAVNQSSDHDELRLPAPHKSAMLRVDTVKFLADGGLSSATAALSVPYRNSASTGVLRFRMEDLRALFLSAQRQGWRIATHAIGDVAIEQVLALYEELATHPRGGSRPDRLHHRVEHLGLPSNAQLQRLAQIAVAVSTQPIFLDELGENILAVVPPSLLAQTYPFREMLAAGLSVAFSSDAPVVRNDDPLAGIEAAIQRRSRSGESIHPEQAITVAEALHAYTLAGAMLTGDEDNRGSIRAGSWADFAVLSGDPLKVDPDEIGTLHVEQTYLGGRLVYSRANSTGA